MGRRLTGAVCYNYSVERNVMAIRYRTGGYGVKEIEEIEIEKETESSVWVDGCVNRKWTDYHKYHASWKEAKAYLVDVAEQKLKRCLSQYDSARDKLSQIKKLEKL